MEEPVLWSEASLFLLRTYFENKCDEKGKAKKGACIKVSS